MLTFVDTNVLVYAQDSSDPLKKARVEEWLKRLWQRGHGRTCMLVRPWPRCQRRLSHSSTRAFLSGSLESWAYTRTLVSTKVSITSAFSPRLRQALARILGRAPRASGRVAGH